MTPNDPLAEDPQYIEVAAAAPPVPPFWDYLDLGFLISFFFPSLFVAAFLVKGVSGSLNKPLQALLGQLIVYGFIFGFLYALLRLRYGQPFWRSLGWKFNFRSAAASFFSGPLVAIAVGYLGSMLRAPEIPNPFQQMFQDRSTLIAFGIFVVVLGPPCEELVFRGFLMPLLMRSFGAASGVVLTGALFGCLHGFELSWSWRHMLLLSSAGTVFGWVRYRTGSTAAAAIMHSTYNLTQFTLFVVQQNTI